MKKLTYEFIKEQFEKEGYTLLTKIYENNLQKLEYICSKGHKHFIRWNNWQRNKRCPYCAGQTKPTIKFIRSEFEKGGYILLTKIYKNAHQKLEYICPEGHRHSINWNHWQQGCRCPYCANNVKLIIEFIRKQFAKEGYQLLTIEYKNSFQKLDYICPKGHKHSITWGHWQQGCRCPHCANNGKPTIEFIRAKFAKEGYELLTKIYKNCYQKLKYMCPSGHKHFISWTNWRIGKRCPICYRNNNFGPNHPNWKGGVSFEPYCPIWKDKEYAEFIKQRDGYKCLNPYCNSKNPNDLTRHHINYNKKDCRKENLITACRSCNTGANFDREWHEAWYKAIMHMRYGYKY